MRARVPTDFVKIFSMAFLFPFLNREGAQISGGKKAGLLPVTGEYTAGKRQAGRLLGAVYFCLSLLTSGNYAGSTPVG